MRLCACRPPRTVSIAVVSELPAESEPEPDRARKRQHEGVLATPLDRITLTPGTRADSASDSVRPRNGARAAESITPTDAPFVRSDAGVGQAACVS